MLVLSRQRDEEIMIGDHIRIAIVEIRGDKVRLGIQAPSDVSVHRREVYEAIRRGQEPTSRKTADEVRAGSGGADRVLLVPRRLHWGRATNQGMDRCTTI